MLLMMTFLACFGFAQKTKASKERPETCTGREKKKKGIVNQAYLTIFMLTKTIQIATLHDNTEHTTQKFELQLDLKHY